MVSGNIKDLIACRKVTETFISGNLSVTARQGALGGTGSLRTLPLPRVWRKAQAVGVPCNLSFGCQGPPIMRKYLLLHVT